MAHEMRFQLQPSYARGDEWLQLAKEEGFTFEVAELSYPLQDEHKRDVIEKWYRDSGLVTNLHGVFVDINPASNEPDIARVSERLCEGSCRMAASIGAQGVIFHSQAFPYLRGDYIEKWAEKSADYYRKLADKYGVKIYIENSSDLDPEPLLLLMKKCADPRVRVCLDVGHANYSRVPLQTWILELNDYIEYIHLSDNFGAFDDHMPLGVGTVPWDLVSRFLRAIKHDLIVTLETGTVEQTRKSLKFLKEKKLFIWDSDEHDPGEQVDLTVTPRTKEEIRIDRLTRRSKKLWHESELLGSVFRRYLSDDIMLQILNDPEGTESGGKKKHITMMMSDLHGFTAMSETMEPQQLLKMLNHYYARMNEIAHKYHGTVIDMIGDGLFVAFGLFRQEENHADQAVKAAVEMVRAMEDVNRWNMERDYPEVHVGIGITTGDVVAGNIGSTRHAKYGVVGSQVNLCSRIEGCTKNDEILFTESTLRYSETELPVKDRRFVTLKGIDGEVLLYQLDCDK